MRKFNPVILLVCLMVLITLVSPVMIHLSQTNSIPRPLTALDAALTASPEATVAELPALAMKVSALTLSTSRYEATYAATLFKLINAERARHGLKKLALNTRLNTAAIRHSTDMAKNNFFSHTGSNGSSMTDRITKAGYKYSAAGENLYAGDGELRIPQQCLNAWLNSAGHRGILLSSAYTQVGVGYKYNASSTYGGYYTADFGKPR